MVQARFINDTTPVDVHGENEQTTVNVTSQTESKRVNIHSSGEHEYLLGRDKPNQHPIEAITGLQDILNKLWTYTFEQAVASDTWIIKHNLGRNPSVVVVDSAGTVFYPAVHYDNENQCTITMNGATTGKAYLN